MRIVTKGKDIPMFRNKVAVGATVGWTEKREKRMKAGSVLFLWQLDSTIYDFLAKLCEDNPQAEPNCN